MSSEEIKNLRTAYSAVFDENGHMKACGRNACIKLINLMSNYTSEDVGNENTGILKIDAMKSAYYRVIVT